MAAPAVLAAQSTARAPDALPLPPAGADGWVSLINGRNLEGFYTMLVETSAKTLLPLIK